MVDAQQDDAIPIAHSADPHSGAFFTRTLHHDTYPAISPSLSDLTGRSVLISGASRGIGRTLAVSYALARASKICLTARGDLSETTSAIDTAVKDAGFPSPEIVSLKVDVVDPRNVEAAAAEVAQKWPEGLDILISNAGYLESFAKIHESDPEEWWYSWAVNIRGPYNVARYFLPQLLKREDGLKMICNMTSIGAHMVFSHMSAYNTAKLALCRLTETLDVEYAGQGLIAFSMHPGGVKTDMGLSLPEDKHAMLTDTPELVSDSVVWLTRERRQWLAARYISCQWDMEQLEARKGEIEGSAMLKVRMVVQA